MSINRGGGLKGDLVAHLRPLGTSRTAAVDQSIVRSVRKKDAVGGRSGYRAKVQKDAYEFMPGDTQRSDPSTDKRANRTLWGGSRNHSDGPDGLCHRPNHRRRMSQEWEPPLLTALHSSQRRGIWRNSSWNVPLGRCLISLIFSLDKGVPFTQCRGSLIPPDSTQFISCLFQLGPKTGSNPSRWS